MRGSMALVVLGLCIGVSLACAQAISFEDAVRLVQYRGQIMQHAVPEGTGAMAAILGLNDADVEAVCAQAEQGEVVQAVNYNSPAQVVIAGHASAVERAMSIAKERGAKRAVLLPVSVPAHSPLLRDAAQLLGHRLQAVQIRAPVFRYISAVDGAEHSQPADIRSNLVQQLASPVRWTLTVQQLAGRVRSLVECGPGKVLTGLNRRIDRGVNCYALEDPASLSAAIAATCGGEAAGVANA